MAEQAFRRAGLTFKPHSRRGSVRSVIIASNSANSARYTCETIQRAGGQTVWCAPDPVYCPMSCPSALGICVARLVCFMILCQASQSPGPGSNGRLALHMQTLLLLLPVCACHPSRVFLLALACCQCYEAGQQLAWTLAFTGTVNKNDQSVYMLLQVPSAFSIQCNTAISCATLLERVSRAFPVRPFQRQTAQQACCQARRLCTAASSHSVAMISLTFVLAVSQQSYRKAVTTARRDKKGQGRAGGLTEEQKQEIR